ncbi:pre-piRNA 3'-exonuclease trimmer-like [Spodoptera litura]|uniref:Pre-piRNA 3'-exonuclease trimmer-like n=1 Tax=Spodoptera litura TaxID=69820 RepID=A0A9J7E2M5_SPOLT|nr:pre-piRNA 3'-exonuclease trimmer-like [Spodoptera litura]
MEVTSENFDEEFDNFKIDLKNACFVSFDAEFNALLSGDKFKHRLFDTNEERYNLIKNDVDQLIMTQVGLTMFEYHRDRDRYIAKSYTFYLCPQSFSEIDQSFVFLASTLKFLRRHHFDFNKFIYGGVPYLSKAEETVVRQNLKENTLFNQLTRTLQMDDEKLLQDYCSEVSKWLIRSNDDTMYLNVPNHILRYVTHMEVRMRFPSVVTTNSLGDSKKILIYRNVNVEGAISTPREELENNLLDGLLGFSRVIALLAESQKPIAGHNLFIDTIILHNQFIGPLPNKYKDFKKNVHNMFPILYDTKYLSSIMAKKLPHNGCWKSNALQDLYEFFAERKFMKLHMWANDIELRKPFASNQTYHEAGWDSYCTGFCFIRLAHWVACENRGNFANVGPTEKLKVLKPYCNKVNVIRGAVQYMNFAEDDPPRFRPQLLHLMLLKENSINVGKVASELGAYGSIDIKPYGNKAALIATGSQQVAQKILKEFRNSKEYKIALYSHSPAKRVALWSGALITGSIVLYLLHQKLR